MRALLVVMAVSAVGCGPDASPAPADVEQRLDEPLFPVTLHYGYADGSRGPSCHVSHNLTEARFQSLGAEYPACKVKRSPWGGEIDCMCYPADVFAGRPVAEGDCSRVGPPKYASADCGWTPP